MTTAVAPPGLEASRQRSRVPRFSRTERFVHWTTAIAMSLLVATGLVLYVGQLSAIVGRRETIRFIHIWSGFALAVPIVVGVLGPWRAALVTDLRRLSRWTRDDKRWLLHRRVRLAGLADPASARLGKFNAGQKVFAAFVGGAIPVMLATGSMMHWFQHFDVDLRTGATFVHDWIALGLFVLVPVHIFEALSEPTLLRSMVRGWVPRRWAETHRPQWLAQTDAHADLQGDTDTGHA